MSADSDDESSDGAGDVPKYNYEIDIENDIDATDAGGNSTLLLAVENDDYVAVRRLVRAGADIEHRNDEGRRPLHVAVRSNAWKSLRVLVAEGADLESDSANDYTALHLAIESDNAKTVRYLLRNGADPNYSTFEWEENGNRPPLSEAILRADLTIVKLLLAAGAEVNNDAYDLAPPLLSAIINDCQISLITALLLARADPNQKGTSYPGEPKFTPLWFAAQGSRDPRIISLLIAAGGDVNILSSNPYRLEPELPRDAARRNNRLALFDAAVSEAAVQKEGFAAIRNRATEIAIAQFMLRLPALPTMEILKAACRPFSEHIHDHYLYELAATVKHFLETKNYKELLADNLLSIEFFREKFLYVFDKYNNRVLDVRQSAIAGAGLGVFTNRAFVAGEPITEYVGKIITDREAKALPGPQRTHLRTLIPLVSVIDGNYLPDGTRLSNTVDEKILQLSGNAVGAIINDSVTPNAEYVFYDSPERHAAIEQSLTDPGVRIPESRKDRIVYIRAIRNIAPGEELLVYYGDKYDRSGWVRK